MKAYWIDHCFDEPEIMRGEAVKVQNGWRCTPLGGTPRFASIVFDSQKAATAELVRRLRQKATRLNQKALEL